MKYSTNLVTNGYGMAYAYGTGYDIADMNVIGQISIETGLNKLNHPPTTNSIYVSKV